MMGEKPQSKQSVLGDRVNPESLELNSFLLLPKTLRGSLTL